MWLKTKQKESVNDQFSCLPNVNDGRVAVINIRGKQPEAKQQGNTDYIKYNGRYNRKKSDFRSKLLHHHRYTNTTLIRCL